MGAEQIKRTGKGGSNESTKVSGNVTGQMRRTVSQPARVASAHVRHIEQKGNAKVASAPETRPVSATAKVRQKSSLKAGGLQTATASADTLLKGMLALKQCHGLASAPCAQSPERSSCCTDSE